MQLSSTRTTASVVPAASGRARSPRARHRHRRSRLLARDSLSPRRSPAWPGRSWPKMPPVVTPTGDARGSGPPVASWRQCTSPEDRSRDRWSCGGCYGAGWPGPVAPPRSAGSPSATASARTCAGGGGPSWTPRTAVSGWPARFGWPWRRPGSPSSSSARCYPPARPAPARVRRGAGAAHRPCRPGPLGPGRAGAGRRAGPAIRGCVRRLRPGAAGRRLGRPGARGPAAVRGRGRGQGPGARDPGGGRGRPGHRGPPRHQPLCLVQGERTARGRSSRPSRGRTAGSGDPSATGRVTSRSRPGPPRFGAHTGRGQNAGCC